MRPDIQAIQHLTSGHRFPEFSIHLVLSLVFPGRVESHVLLFKIKRESDDLLAVFHFCLSKMLLFILHITKALLLLYLSTLNKLPSGHAIYIVVCVLSIEKTSYFIIVDIIAILVPHNVEAKPCQST